MNQIQNTISWFRNSSGCSRGGLILILVAAMLFSGACAKRSVTKRWVSPELKGPGRMVVAYADIDGQLSTRADGLWVASRLCGHEVPDDPNRQIGPSDGIVGAMQRVLREGMAPENAVILAEKADAPYIAVVRIRSERSKVQKEKESYPPDSAYPPGTNILHGPALSPDIAPFMPKYEDTGQWALSGWRIIIDVWKRDGRHTGKIVTRFEDRNPQTAMAQASEEFRKTFPGFSCEDYAGPLLDGASFGD